MVESNLWTEYLNRAQKFITDGVIRFGGSALQG